MNSQVRVTCCISCIDSITQFQTIPYNFFTISIIRAKQNLILEETVHSCPWRLYWLQPPWQSRLVIDLSIYVVMVPVRTCAQLVRASDSFERRVEALHQRRCPETAVSILYKKTENARQMFFLSRRKLRSNCKREDFSQNPSTDN